MEDETPVQETDTEQAPPQDPRDAEIQRLKRENAQYRAKTREAEAARLKVQYGVDLTPDDLKGVDAAVLDRILAQAKPQGGQTGEHEAPNAEAIAAMVTHTQTAQANTGAPPKEVVAVSEAQRRVKTGEWTEAQYLENAQARLGK